MSISRSTVLECHTLFHVRRSSELAAETEDERAFPIGLASNLAEENARSDWSLSLRGDREGARCRSEEAGRVLTWDLGDGGGEREGMVSVQDMSVIAFRPGSDSEEEDEQGERDGGEGEGEEGELGGK